MTDPTPTSASCSTTAARTVSSATPHTTRTTCRSRATTSCSAPVRCSTPIGPSSAPNRSSTTPPATTTATARTPRRPQPATPKSRPACTAWTSARSPASRPGPDHRLQGPRRTRWLHVRSRGGHRSGRVRRRRRHQLLDRRRRQPPDRRRRHRLPLRRRCRRVRGDIGRQQRPGADTVGSPGNAPWLTTVGANTQPRFYEGEVKTKGGPRSRAPR